jgi:xanthine dehydrogenase YagS FAD-binding subunit
MKAFTYRVATSEESAAKLLGAKSLALAGGTSLINLMKNYVLQPDVLVNVKTIPGLDKIEKAGDGLKIGANVRLADLAASEAITRDYPALAQAAAEVASPQIRNMATLGGNLCQRPACWYFTQEGFECLKKGSGSCAAKNGENEFHAILGNDGPCVMVHPSTAAPALVALGAKVRIAGPGGAREIPVEEFFIGPQTDVQRENVLAPNEIVTHVLLGPARPRSATYIARAKVANDWPLAIAAVALELAGETAREARICLGAVAPVPWRAAGAEAALKEKPITAESASAAAAAALAGAAPLRDNGYKVPAARAAVKRAILLAAGKSFL